MPELAPITHSDQLRERVTELIPSFYIARRVGVSITYITGLPEGRLYVGYEPGDSIAYDEDTFTLRYVEPVESSEEKRILFVSDIQKKVEANGVDSLSDEELNLLFSGSMNTESALQSWVELAPQDGRVIHFVRSIGRIREYDFVDIWEDYGEAYPEKLEDDKSKLSLPFSFLSIEKRMDDLAKLMFRSSFNFSTDHEQELFQASERIVRQELS